MIKNILHKGLRLYYTKGDGSKLPGEFKDKIGEILDILDAISDLKDISNIGKGVHQLKGNLKGRWAIFVSANYRITFEFAAPDVINIDYEDYH